MTRLPPFPLPRAILLPLVLVLCASASGQPPPTATPPAADAASTPAPPAAQETPTAASDAPAVPPADEAAPPDAVTPEQEAQQSDLPKFEDLEIPTMEQLLRGAPVDWIVLYSGRVLIVNPVTTRPDPLGQMKAAIEASYQWPRGKNREEVAKQTADRVRLNYLRVFLSGVEDDTEYQLHLRYIEQILCFEDLILRRVDLQLDSGELEQALELLLYLDRRHRGWPGYDARQQRLLLLEAERHAAEGTLELALARLQDLHLQNPEYNGLSRLLGQVVDRLIRRAIEGDDRRAARHFLQRLALLSPRHAVALQWTQQLIGEAASLMDEARAAAAAQDAALAADRIDRAADVWPDAPGLRELHRRLMTRYPIVEVGVLHHGAPPESLLVPSTADADRVAALTHAPLFEVRSIERGIPRYHSRYFEQWEPHDRREIRYVLRGAVPPWQSRHVTTGGAVVTELAARLERRSSRYDERFAGYVETVSLHSPAEFALRFARVPLRPEPLLDHVAARDAGREEPFRLDEERGTTRVYRRARPEPAETLVRHVAEVRETAFGDHERAFQALRRGEVSVLTPVYGRYVAPLRDDGRFFVHQRAPGTTHLLQFHPESPPAKSRQLRRALTYGIDRASLLADIVLRDADGSLGRLATGPFPSSGYGHHPLLRPSDDNLALAVALALGAKQELGEQNRPLRLACVDDPVAQEVAPRLVDHWKRAGLSVTLLSTAEIAGGAEWDILYRTAQVVEPIYELWPLLALSRDARIDDLAHLPDWLRQGLLDLEYATDWNAALERLRTLQEELLAEAQIIPLWELDEFLVVRKNIGEVPLRPVHPYADVERWTVQPWYETELP